MENPEIKLVLVLILSFVYFGLHLKKIILIVCIFQKRLWYSVVDKSFGKSRVISLWKRMGTIRLDPKFQAYKEDLKSLLCLNGNCYTCFPPKMGFDCKYQIKFPFNFSPFDCTPNIYVQMIIITRKEHKLLLLVHAFTCWYRLLIQQV